MNRKAQAATEYLIVLAVVVIIALIVVSITGGIPGIGKGAAGRASAAYWATADVAINSYGVSEGGADSVAIKNNLRSPISVSAVVINGVDLETATSTLGVGGTVSYSGAIATCTAGQAYAYSVSITFTDTKTNLTTTITGDGAQLEGTCTA